MPFSALVTDVVDVQRWHFLSLSRNDDKYVGGAVFSACWALLLEISRKQLISSLQQFFLEGRHTHIMLSILQMGELKQR